MVYELVFRRRTARRSTTERVIAVSESREALAEIIYDTSDEYRAEVITSPSCMVDERLQFDATGNSVRMTWHIGTQSAIGIIWRRWASELLIRESSIQIV